MKAFKYHNGDVYFISNRNSIYPSIEPVEKYDLDELSKDEIEQFKQGKNHDKLLKKAKRIK